jgi:hypothetical protein
MFLGLGGVFFFLVALKPWFGMWQARSWVATPCTVVSSELKRGDDTEQLVVVFKYTVAQQDYQSDTYCFSSMSSNTATNWKCRVLRDHPPGKQTNCFVNPSNPEEAVIERGWVPDMWWGFFPIPFLLVGGVALLVALGAIRLPPTNASATRWQPGQRVSSSSTVPMESSEPTSPTEGPVTLQPASSPLANLVGSLFVAVFWNGIVSIFVWEVIQEFQKGQVAGRDWFEVVFLTPFVLIGVGMIGFAFYSLLALFNPRPTLTIDSAAIPLGESLRLTWHLAGRLSSINQFTISLKGVEKATYRRGTDTTTDTKTFAEIPIFETTEMFEMSEGLAEIVVPSDTMHSFDAPNNKIQWTLEVHGDITLWPDMSASFPITILPKTLKEEA